MSSYPPPIEVLPIFNPAVFVVKDTPLTIAEGEKYFLKYPQAQGTQNFTDINVGGTATIEDIDAYTLEVSGEVTCSTSPSAIDKLTNRKYVDDANDALQTSIDVLDVSMNNVETAIDVLDISMNNVETAIDVLDISMNNEIGRAHV